MKFDNTRLGNIARNIWIGIMISISFEILTILHTISTKTYSADPTRFFVFVFAAILTYLLGAIVKSAYSAVRGI